MEQNSKISILHIIQCLNRGGAARAHIAAAKYSSRSGPYKHTIASLVIPEEEGVALAQDEGLEYLPSQNISDIKKAMSEADIVQLSWWNNTEMADLLHSELPECRLMAWYHVGGEKEPMVVTDNVVRIVDFSVACSPFTYNCSAISSLSETYRSYTCSLAYGAADFDRLEGVELKQHQNFNVGYIGTIDFMKMHPDYVKMSLKAQIPEARFVICGSGSDVYTVTKQAELSGAPDKFKLKGFVDDIKSEIELFDVYGYPLCEETYAASEINLQEVMYAGIPPVVFPYGGVRYLIEHEKTGLVVNSESEYAEALEFLYAHPEERARIGKNAAEYARNVFGAENAALELNKVYERLIKRPKRQRVWGIDFSCCTSIPETLLNDSQIMSGSDLFIESLGKRAGMFYTSKFEHDISKIIDAEQQIMHVSKLMRMAGVLPYRNSYPDDQYLALWAGLVFLGAGEVHAALNDFVYVQESGFTNWRLFWYIAICAKLIGDLDFAKKAIAVVLKEEPRFQPAVELSNSL